MQKLHEVLGKLIFYFAKGPITNLNQPYKMSSTNFADFTEFNETNMDGLTPLKKPIPSGNNTNNANQNAAQPQAQAPPQKGAPGGMTYSSLPIIYKYGTPDKMISDDLFLQMPEVSCNGIVSFTGDDGKVTESIYVRMDMNNPKHVQFMDVWTRLYNRSAEILFEHRAKMGLGKVSSIESLKEQYNFPIKIKRDSDENPIPGAPPALSMKLATGYAKTSFINRKRQTIPWDALRNVSFKMIPLLHVSSIYKAAQAPSLVFRLSSAIITSPLQKGGNVRQLVTLDKLNEDDPDGVNSVEDVSTLELKKSTAQKSLAAGVASALGAGSDSPAPAAAPEPVSPQAPKAEVAAPPNGNTQLQAILSKGQAKVNVPTFKGVPKPAGQPVQPAQDLN